jgi:HSP20 family protein
MGRRSLLATMYPPESSLWNLSSYFADHWGDSVANFLTKFVPAMDIAETDNSYKIIANIPGLNKDQINIETDEKGKKLQISGELKKQVSENEHFIRIERAQGKFNRVITLPSNADVEKAQAFLEDGVLTINIPKKTPSKEGSKNRAIKIQEQIKSKL